MRAARARPPTLQTRRIRSSPPWPCSGPARCRPQSGSGSWARDGRWRSLGWLVRPRQGRWDRRRPEGAGERTRKRSWRRRTQSLSLRSHRTPPEAAGGKRRRRRWEGPAALLSAVPPSPPLGSGLALAPRPPGRSGCGLACSRRAGDDGGSTSSTSSTASAHFKSLTLSLCQIRDVNGLGPSPQARRPAGIFPGPPGPQPAFFSPHF